MFCANCGRQLPEGAKFCTSCGAPVEQSAPPQPPRVQYAPQAAFAGNGKVRLGIPAPGFSDRENDPEILASVAKSRRIGKKAGFVIALLPLIGFIAYALITGEMEISQAAIYGACVSAVFFLFQLIASRRERARNSYNGVVTDKKWRYRSRSGDNSSHYTEYTVYVRTDDGRKKKIIEHDGGSVIAYHLLNVGDRFRYHANFPFPYELYDKAKGSGIYCVGCQTLNPVENDRCQRCNLPLLK